MFFFALLIMLVSSCTKQKTIYLLASNSNGIEEESSVSIRGLKIGEVKKVGFDKNYNVMITLKITDSLRIPATSHFTFKQNSGRGNVVIIPNGNAPYLQHNDTIVAFELDDSSDETDTLNLGEAVIKLMQTASIMAEADTLSKTLIELQSDINTIERTIKQNNVLP